MIQLTFDVNVQLLTRTDNNKVVSDSINQYEAVFTFDEWWNDYTATAQFTKDGITKDCVLVDNKCTIPHEVLVGGGILHVNVFSTNGEGDRKTVEDVHILVEQSGYTPNGSHAQSPSPNIYEQLLSSTKPPYIGDNGNWFVFEKNEGKFVDSGISAEGKSDVSSVEEAIKKYSEENLKYTKQYDFTLAELVNVQNYFGLPFYSLECTKSSGSDGTPFYCFNVIFSMFLAKKDANRKHIEYLTNLPSKIELVNGNTTLSITDKENFTDLILAIEGNNDELSAKDMAENPDILGFCDGEYLVEENRTLLGGAFPSGGVILKTTLKLYTRTEELATSMVEEFNANILPYITNVKLEYSNNPTPIDKGEYIGD